MVWRKRGRGGRGGRGIGRGGDGGRGGFVMEETSAGRGIWNGKMQIQTQKRTRTREDRIWTWEDKTQTWEEKVAW